MREADGEFFDELAVRVFVEDASAVPAGIRQEIGGVAICIVERQFQPAADTARYNDLRGGAHRAAVARLRYARCAGLGQPQQPSAGLTAQHVVRDPPPGLTAVSRSGTEAERSGVGRCWCGVST